MDRMQTSNTPATHTPSDFLPDSADWAGEAWYDDDDGEYAELEVAATRIQAARRAKTAREDVKQRRSGERMLPSQSLTLELIKRAPPRAEKIQKKARHAILTCHVLARARSSCA